MRIRVLQRCVTAGTLREYTDSRARARAQIITGCYKCSTDCGEDEEDSLDVLTWNTLYANCVPCVWGTPTFYLILSNVFFAVAALLPMVNLVAFLRLKAALLAMTPVDEAPWTFNGRPGSGAYAQKEGGAKNVRGSDVLLEHISPLWQIDEDGTLCMNKRLNNQAWNPQKPWKTTYDDSGNIKSVYTGLRPEDIANAKEMNAEIDMEKQRRQLARTADAQPNSQPGKILVSQESSDKYYSSRSSSLNCQCETDER